jgi:DNA repair protein RAD5
VSSSTDSRFTCARDLESASSAPSPPSHLPIISGLCLEAPAHQHKFEITSSHRYLHCPTYLHSSCYQTMDIDARPVKKRRFFVDDSDTDDSPIETAPSPIPSPIEPALHSSDAFHDTSPSTRVDTRETSLNGRLGSSQTEIIDLEDEEGTAGEVEEAPAQEGFDADTFSAFVGESVSEGVLKRVREAAGDSMERAVNMWFDGSWKTASPEKKKEVGALPFQSKGRTVFAFSDRSGSSSKNDTPAAAAAPAPVGLGAKEPDLLHRMPERRYVGGFGVGAWTTKSGVNLLRHDEQVKIERSRKKPITKMGRGGKLVQKPNQKNDVLVRFTNMRGEELGRLPQEYAEWVSALMDQKVCTFEGKCVYAPERVRVGDTIYLQLRCSVLASAFDKGNFAKMSDNRTTGLYEEKETSEEKELRTRQVALVKLFDEINLKPTSVNETTVKHKKSGILRAAEMAEQYDKDDSKKKKDEKSEGKTDGTSTPQSEEAEDGEELEQDQLDALYKKAQSFDFNTPEAQPADTFSLDLRKYQKQALHWMMTKEKDESTRQTSMHPLWEEYTWPTKDYNDSEVSLVKDQDKFYVNPYSGELSLEFPVQEQNCLGGILADEMGLGKTIEMLSLMHTHRSDEVMDMDEDSRTVNSLNRLSKTTAAVEPAPYTTLVVAPMSLLAQWESEAEKASKSGSMRTLVYYGGDKVANLQELCSARTAQPPNLIITSYGIVLSEYNQIAANGTGRGAHGGLFSVEFFRIILDEAHHIKNRQAKTSKACYELSGIHRWVLTGTPIVNRLEDLFSLVRFLKVEPWSNFSFWKTFITVPFESKDFIRALDVVQTVLEPLVLRRTKDMKTPDGEALVPLPPRTITIEEVELSKPEREVYDHIYTRAKRTFNQNMEAGTLLKSYTTIFAQILRLRQSCCHPVLTRNQDVVADEEDAAAAAASDANNLSDDMDLQELIDRFTSSTSEEPEQQDARKFGAHVLKQIQDEAENECPICSEDLMDEPAVIGGCWHSACKKCLEDYITHQVEKRRVDNPRCFSCREPINPRDIFEIIRSSSPSVSPSDPLTSNPKISLRRINPLSPTLRTSAKISALITHLTRIRKINPQSKTVVFSQFTAFLDLISPALSRSGLNHLRFDGTLSQKARADVLARFNTSDGSANSPTVLLLSLRAGGVGLNLTAANRVFMMDPWWSFAVEAQAIDRVHRMGQLADVEVVRFVVKDSIEGRMLKVQERKMWVSGALGMMSEEERKERRVEEIRELLG